MQPLKKSTKTPFVRKPHSIRLVEIPPTTNSSRGIKLSVESAPRHPQPSEAHCHGLRISEWVHLFIPSRLLNSSLNGRTCLWRYHTWLLHFSLLNDSCLCLKLLTTFVIGFEWRLGLVSFYNHEVWCPCYFYLNQIWRYIRVASKQKFLENRELCVNLYYRETTWNYV